MTDPPDPPLIVRTVADPTTPVLLTGLAASVMMSADAEIRCPWETRGAILDWGGAYSQGVRLTGPWEVRLTIDGRAASLAESLVQLTTRRWGLRSEHRAGSVRVVQEVTPFPTAPAVGRRFTFTAAATQGAVVVVESSFAPSLAPVLVEGIQPYELELRMGPAGPEVRALRHLLRFEVAAPTIGWTVNDRPWDGTLVKGEVGSLGARWERRLGPGETCELDLVVAGGVEPALPPAGGGGPSYAGSPGREVEASRLWLDWEARCARLRFPDDPKLERSVELARGALRSLYSAPDETTHGLVAGFPWYCAIWSRDLAWTLPAVLWLGDTDWVQKSLETVFRYQAPHRIAILAAEEGELPMQVSPGPVFLYGTSDTSLYFPPIVQRFLRHSGRREVAAGWWRHLQGVLGWARGKVDPATGLFTNGGETLELKQATEGLGSMHFGIDARDTTIWDSTDRRSHAVELQVLYAASLRATTDLATEFGHLGEIGGCDVEAGRAEAAIREQYWWPEEGYLYDTFRPDGTPGRQLRPNALLAVSAGLLDPLRARTAVARALRDDLSTPWGLRTLSSADPGYDPEAYHDGQVWTIATAWAAEASFAAGDAAHGFSLLRTIGDRILAENGLANECYYGDRPVPFDSCFLLGFSIGPFLTVVFERLWGLHVNAGVLSVRPAFPSSWGSARLEGLRVGDGRATLDWRPDRLSVQWSGPGPLTVGVAAGSSTVAAGGSAEFALPAQTS